MQCSQRTSAIMLLWSAGAIVTLCHGQQLRAQAPTADAAGDGVIIEQGIPAKMRDGVVLRADIYRPAKPGKFPILLKRTPYSKNVSSGPSDKLVGQDWHWGFVLQAVARGYVVIIQDSRGRYTSDGEWYPFRETEDGYDTVEWAASLPYSNGKVGTWGMSYNGSTQLQTAIGSPPHLTGIFPVMTGSDVHAEGGLYQGGVLARQSVHGWTSQLAEDALYRRIDKDRSSQRYLWMLPADDPLFEPGNTHGLVPFLQDWLAHPAYDGYWKQLSIEEHHAKILVPAYHINGWYDSSVRGALRNYIGIKAHGGSDAARQGQRLLVGPWPHRPPPYVETRTGDVDFGAGASLDLNLVALRWYDHILKGIDNGIEREKPVRIFVMGRNTWRDEADWPLARAHATSFYLESNGKANGLSGDGSVSREFARTEVPDHYVYDPQDPVPTRGSGGDARDQRPVEARNDILIYSTPPLKEELEVTGPIRAEIYASSSAVDTDFTVRLVDVWENGFAQNLTDGILRARYSKSPENAEFLNPGEIYKFTIDLGATSNVFLAGHKLRIEITSSNFPRFERNTNTGEDPSRSTRMVKATNTVYHDREHPSALILPVVPN